LEYLFLLPITSSFQQMNDAEHPISKHHAVMLAQSVMEDIQKPSAAQ